MNRFRNPTVSVTQIQLRLVDVAMCSDRAQRHAGDAVTAHIGVFL